MKKHSPPANMSFVSILIISTLSTNKDIALHNLTRAQREYSPSKNPFSTVNRIQSHGRKLDSRRAFKGKDEGLSLLREINQARGEPSS